MSNRSIHGNFVGASQILQALGDDLLKVKMGGGEGGKPLRWAEIGEVLGVSEDQAAKYADGSAMMGVVAYTRGRIAWDGKFTGSLDQLVRDAGGHIDGQHSQTLILKAALSLSAALEDGSLTNAEILANRSTLEEAKAAIEKLLCRVGPKAVSA